MWLSGCPLRTELHLGLAPAGFFSFFFLNSEDEGFRSDVLSPNANSVRVPQFHSLNVASN